MIGRHPHIGRFQWESAEDLEVGRAALASVDLEGLAHRDVLTVSGGERRRLAIAQVLLAAGFAFNSGTDTSFHFDSLVAVGREDEFADREERIASGFADEIGGDNSRLKLETS